MNEHRARFEHEEMDTIRNTGHLAQDAIELRGKRPTHRHGEQPAHANEPEGFPEQRRRDAPAREAERAKSGDLPEPLVHRHGEQHGAEGRWRVQSHR